MEPASSDDQTQAEQATLRDLCREFPQFAIWREVMPGHTRFNAQRIGTGRRPCLTVTSRHAGTEQDVYAGRASYWSGTGEPIGRVSDPLAAGRQAPRERES